MISSQTRSSTYTSTFPKIVYVTRKVQADFLAILDTYGYFSEEYAIDLISDVRTFLDEEVIDRIRFSWTETGGKKVLFEYQYEVLVGEIGLADDRAGGVPFRRELANACFTVIVTYNTRWQSMDENEKDTIRKILKLQWGPAGRLDYSGGTWIVDRTYSKDGFGLARKRFER